MHSPPRSYIVSARTFDGVTRPTSADKWTPSGLMANAPLQGKTDQETIGRFAWQDLLRSGSNPALVTVRRYGEGDPGDSFTVRTVAADELASGQPEPSVLDSLQETVPLTNEWSDLTLLGSSDALCINHSPSDEFGTVEIMVFDLSGQAASDFLRARAKPCCDVAPTVAVFDVTTTASGALPEPTADLNFYLCTGNQGATFTLPGTAVLSSRQQCFVTNLDPAQPIRLQAAIGNVINGIANGADWAVLAGGDGVLVRSVRSGVLFGTQVA